MSIEKITKDHNLSQSENIVESNIDKLKALFPEIVTEGKIDFKVLQEVLGNELEVGEEYYRFTWAGKANARREAQKPSTGTLRPAPEESTKRDGTAYAKGETFSSTSKSTVENSLASDNLYIEGDNLEVLKLLQKGYAGKVKMIYIDPPYNTGKDFVYKDNYKDNLRNYQEITGQVDDEGNRLSTNSDSDGRYHSNWLNMMYPRLRLARNLLKDDGVIFMSIDDTEVDNLRRLANEVFGEDNFIANIIWERAYSPVNLKKHFSENHDFVLCYSKKLEFANNNGLKRSNEANSRYSNPDNDERGSWKSSDLSVAPVIEEKLYEITTPSGRVVTPPKGRCWVLSKDRFNEFLADNRIWFGSKGDAVPSVKKFLTEVKNTVTPMTIWKYADVGHSQQAAQNLKKLFDGNSYFDYPKPVTLIKQAIELYTNAGDVIIDFFSGSGTSAHAVMRLNAEDDGNRKHIQVQLPEPTEEKSEAFKAGYKTIAEIGKERIRRAAKKIAEENPEKAKNLDLGFKVFKLDTSNIKGWDGNPDNLQMSLEDAVGNIKHDRTEHDVLYEILLKYGLDLTLPIEEKHISTTLDGTKKVRVFSVGYGALFICLADNITSAVAQGIGEWKEELQPEVCRVVFKDSGFTDVEKTNSVQTLKRHGITEIKSI